MPIPWPGWNTSAWHEEATKPELTGYQHYWYGSLSVGMRDASGQMYMRNRYYNPQSGQFTQPDPIGLAGGMNVYGFAAGDPVTYSDPFGLCPEEKQVDGKCPGGMSPREYVRFEFLFIMHIGGAAGDPLLEMLENGMVRVDEVMEGSETRVQAVHFSDNRPSYLRVGPTLWDEGTAAAASSL